VDSRWFPDSKDYCDGNWLIVTARCCASQADVSVNGPILHLSELHSWMVKCEACASLLGEANLNIEPNIAIKLNDSAWAN